MNTNESSFHPPVVDVDSDEDMGIGASTPRSRGIILSLDALGTIYRFRAPVANQYLSIAQKCGLKAKVELPDLEASFKQAFKSVSTEYPNYGKDKLPDPEAWWSELVSRSFKPVVQNEELPPDLGRSLYQHFSSGAAYELYPDVRPFLQAIHKIREDPDSPTLILGIITNSDPRVKQVLESMNLKIGMSGVPKRPSREELVREAREDTENYFGTGRIRISVPWRNLWKAGSDFDFLATSYDARSEKPNPAIMFYARQMARMLNLSQVIQGLPAPKTNLGGIFNLIRTASSHRKDVDNMAWIHVGDDYEKDIAPTKVETEIMPGIKLFKRHGIHLVRHGGGTPVEGADTVTSLTEVASIINLMVQEPNN